MVSCSLQRLWVPVGLNDNLQTILINSCAKDNNVGDWHDMDRMVDMLEGLEQKLEGLLQKHSPRRSYFSTERCNIHPTTTPAPNMRTKKTTGVMNMAIAARRLPSPLIPRSHSLMYVHLCVYAHHACRRTNGNKAARGL